MAYVVGIDIGTSFTAAAIARLEPDYRAAPQSLNLGQRGGAAPTVIYLAEEGSVFVGEAAERRGLDHPHRLLREFKRRVGDTVPIVVGDICVTPEDIFATMARWVVDRAEEQEGMPPEAVTLSHPASWGSYKTDLVRNALAGVGLADVKLLSEPEAAALHYAAAERVEEGKTIAVYDLGGGTFDVAILRKDGTESFHPLGRATGIERLGGADFDESVFGFVTENMGEGFTGLDGTDPGVLVALTRLRRECIEAKEALSFDTEATIPVLLPGAQAQLRLVRSEFEAMIERPIRESITTLTRAMEVAGVEAADLEAILLIGGSSRIPLVAQLLSVELDRPIAIDADPKASISLGAAFSGAQQWRAVNAGHTLEDPAAPLDGAGDVGHVRSPSAARPTTFGGGAAAFVPPAQAHAMPAYARTGVRLATVSVVAGLLMLAGTASYTAPDASFLAADSQAQASEGKPAMAAAPVAGQQTPGPTAPEDAGPGANLSPFLTTEPRDPGTPGPSTPPSQRATAPNDTAREPSISPESTTNADPAAPLAAPATTTTPPISSPTPAPEPEPAPAPAPTPAPTSEPTPAPIPEPAPTPDPFAGSDPTPDPTPSSDPTTSPEPTSVPVEPGPEPLNATVAEL